MKLQEVTAYNLRSETILNESWQGLTETQRLYVGRWEKELWPLLEEYTRLAEATLTANQIQDIFKGAEAQANASGDNKNLLGKGASAAGAAAKLPVQIAKQVDAKINELGKLAQNAGPVKNADAKFEELKKKISAENSDSKIVQGIKQVSDWAKANPKKASLAVGILTAIAAFAGGPVGGAAAGLILRASKDLLQGEKLSTAIGKSVKTAAYGAMAGWLFNQLGDIIEGMRIESVPFEKEGVTAIKFDIPQVNTSGTNLMGGASSSSFGGQGTLWVSSSDTSWTPWFKELIAKSQQGDISAFYDLQNARKVFDLSNALQTANATNEFMKQMAVDNDAMLKIIQSTNDAVSAMAQGSVTATKDGGAQLSPDDVKGPDGKTGKEYDKEGAKKEESLSMEDRFESFILENELSEIDGGAIDAVAGSKAGQAVGGALKKGFGAFKKGAKAAAGKAAAGAKAVGKELGSKVTYNKLMKSWKDAGEPADTASIMNILQDAGMSNDQIATIGQEAKVDLGKPSAKPAADAKVPAQAGANAGTDAQASAQADAQAGTDAQAGAQAGADAQDTAQTGNKLPSAQDVDNTDQFGKGDAGNNTKQTKTATAKPIKKGDTQEVNGKTYQWAGALWVDTATKKPIGVIPSMKLGLPNPKLQPIIDAAKKDPQLAKLIKQQVQSKGVEAGSAGAQKAAQAGVKGTEKLDAKGVTR